MTTNFQPLSTTQRRIQQNFQRGGRKYNDNAYVQKQIAIRLVEHLTQATSSLYFHSVLEIGCGTGLLTRELMQRLSVDHWTINDLVSESRVHIAPILKTSAWEFLPGAIETRQLPRKYDLIAPSSAIQWIADTPALLKRLSNNLNPGGWLMHLRNTGVNANAQHQWSRQRLAAFEREYTHRFSNQNQKVCLTYAPVCIIAQSGNGVIQPQTLQMFLQH